MDDITIEKANYIITYYSDLLNNSEKKALRHLRSEFKLEGDNDGNRANLYLRTGWLSADPVILELIKDGYANFAITAATRIIREDLDRVYLNLCPECQKLVRTPQAKQCRHCGHDWH